MKYALKANNILEWLALKTNQIPRPLCDTFMANIQSRCILTAVKHGVFSALLDTPKTVESLAEECSVEADILLPILSVLISCDYLTEDKNYFKLTKKMRKFFIKGSPKSIENNILLSENQLFILSQIDEILETGKAIEIHSSFTEKKYWKCYQSAMLELARELSGSIKRHIPVKNNAKTLLDIGGSHGLFGAAICKEKGMEKSIVLDLPQAIEFAEPLAKQEGYDALVEFREHNVLEKDIDLPSDVVFMGNFLHHFDEQKVLHILAQAKNSLTDDGTVAIFDFSFNRKKSNNLMLTATSLFFKLTSDAQCYSTADYKRFLSLSGFNKIKSKRLLRMPFCHLITARV